MAREYAQIKLAIWADDDWRDLSPMARYLYLTLLTSPTLTHCGTADWRPARIGALNGMTVEQIEDAGAEMVESRHLIIDEDSEEVLIRSFVRNDGLMKQPKMATAMATAHAGVASQVIRGVIVHELNRLRADYPTLSGWGSERATELLGLRSINPSDYPLGKGSRKGSTKGKGTPSGKGSPTPTPTPTPAPSSLTPSESSASADAEREFEEFWSTYPKKRSKGQAAKAFKAARRKASQAQILDGLHRHLGAWAGKDPQFIPYPASWLNAMGWLDEIEQEPLAPPSRLPHASQLEAPPDGLSEEEYAEWIYRRRA